jgi:four helix bundle protein
MTSYRELIVWQKSMTLVTEVYKVTDHFPKSEVYSLTNQIRRAAVSIPSNIAEGYMRGHTKEYIQFLSVAIGSSAELETQLEIGRNLKYFGIEDYNRLTEHLNEVMRMLARLIRVLKSK